MRKCIIIPNYLDEAVKGFANEQGITESGVITIALERMLDIKPSQLRKGNQRDEKSRV